MAFVAGCEGASPLMRVGKYLMILLWPTWTIIPFIIRGVMRLWRGDSPQRAV